MTGDMFLEGHLSIQAAIEAKSRDIHDLLIAESKRFERQLGELRRLADAAGIRVSYVSDDEIGRLVSGASHGGVVARVGERRFRELGDLLPPKQAAFIVMLDGIEDPYNFAGAVRVVYAAGAHGIVLRPRNWSRASAIVGRASAGAFERMPLAIAPDAAAVADFYRAQGLRIAVAAKSSRARPLHEAELKQPLFLLIGGERRGVTRSFIESADLRLSIPYGREFSPSLGTVGAAAVIAFEVMRQRKIADA